MASMYANYRLKNQVGKMVALDWQCDNSGTITHIILIRGHPESSQCPRLTHLAHNQVAYSKYVYLKHAQKLIEVVY